MSITQEINFPLLKTFSVNNDIVNFLNQKFDQYIKSHECNKEITCFNNQNINSGYQTDNLLTWGDSEYQTFLKTILLKIISQNLLVNENQIEYFWTHMLEYKNGGAMGEHKHYHNEDFVFFIYLKTCQSGETIFYLNDYCQEYMDRTSVKIMPTSGKGAIFSSLVLHEGKYTEENKRIFVCGMRVNL
jgi:hypothetical protein